MIIEVFKSLVVFLVLEKKLQVVYKMEIIGGVVVYIFISQNGGDGQEGSEFGFYVIF